MPSLFTVYAAVALYSLMRGGWFMFVDDARPPRDLNAWAAVLAVAAFWPVAIVIGIVRAIWWPRRDA